MPEALREKLKPAFRCAEQATCNPIVKDEHPNPARLLQLVTAAGFALHGARPTSATDPRARSGVVFRTEPRWFGYL
jgi:hypothetical protein